MKTKRRCVAGPLSRFRSLVITLLLILFASAAAADYLIVERAALFKEAPEGSGALILRPEIGSRLELLQDEKVNGYYYAEHPQTGQRGYIYKSLVSRYRETDDNTDTETGLSYPTRTLELSFFDWTTPHVYFHFISVGQADATLIEFPCGVILIDAGTGYPSDEGALVSYLDDFFTERPHLESNVLDAVFITHNHRDHANRIVDILSNYTVRRYFDNGETTSGAQEAARAYIDTASQHTLQQAIMDEDVSETRVGLTNADIDPISCDNCDPVITVLSGGFDNTSTLWSEVNDNPNDRSLVIRIDFGETSALFSGDLQTGMIEILTDFYDGTNLLDVDLYQVGHHGADNGTTQAFAQAMTPDVAVFSMGDPDDTGSGHSAYAYGHPRVSVIERLRSTIQDRRTPTVTNTAFHRGRDPRTVEITRRIYGTGWDGNIVVSGDLNGHLNVAVSDN